MISDYIHCCSLKRMVEINNKHVHPYRFLCISILMEPTTHLCDSVEICWPIFQTNTQTCPYISAYRSLDWAHKRDWIPMFVPTMSISVYMRVCMCVLKQKGGLTCWLPRATALKCVKWGSSQRWALGYEATLKTERECVCVCARLCVCVCHTYQAYVKFTDTSADVSDTEPAGPLHPIPSPHIPPDVEQSFILVCRVMRQTIETEGVRGG